MSNKKIKPIQTIVEEYINKQRNVGNYDLVPQYVKRVQDTVGAQTKHPLTNIFALEALLNNEKYDEALTLAKQAVDQVKDDCVSQHYLARIQYKLQLLDDAEKSLSSSKDNFSQQQQAQTDASAHLATAAYKGLSYQNLALSALVSFAQGKTDAASKATEQLFSELISEGKLAQLNLDTASCTIIQEGIILLARLKKNEGYVV